MMKVLLTAIAAAVVATVSPAKAFDGNDRLFAPDRYSHLPANAPDWYVAEYEYHSAPAYEPPRYRPLRSRRRPAVAGWHSVEPPRPIGPPETAPRAFAPVVEPEPIREPEGEPQHRPLDESPRRSDYYLRQARMQVPPRQTRPADVVCAKTVEAETQLPRPGVAFAKWSTRNVWRSKVKQIHGDDYAKFENARFVKWDCEAGTLQRCALSAVPCKTVE